MTDGVLLVGHGSRSATGVAEMQVVGGLVGAALPEAKVAVGFLELADPPAGHALDGLVAAGCRQVTVLPLVLLGAGHAKSDLPAIALEARERHPGVDVRLGSPLGLSRDLVALLGNAVIEAGGSGLPLLLIGRGTSDPDANGDAHKAARLVAEWTAAPLAHTAFTGVTWPRVTEGLDTLARLGHERVAVAYWFLCHGVLIERSRAHAADFTARTGVEVVDAGYLGPHPALVPAILQRYREATEGVVRVNCDLCAYRSAWPGLEDRVGQAVGVGHSHLAADHRHPS